MDMLEGWTRGTGATRRSNATEHRAGRGLRLFCRPVAEELGELRHTQPVHVVERVGPRPGQLSGGGLAAQGYHASEAGVAEAAGRRALVLAVLGAGLLAVAITVWRSG
jgi:hypothetical protein